MRCTTAHRLMSASLDDELSARERESLTAHLAQCEACGKDFLALQGMHRILGQAEQFSAPSYFSRRLMTRLDNAAARPLFSPLWARFAEGLVILAVIGIGVVSGNLFSNSMGLGTSDQGIASMSLEVFEAAPPQSLSGAYLAMLEVGNER